MRSWIVMTLILGAVGCGGQDASAPDAAVADTTEAPEKPDYAPGGEPNDYLVEGTYIEEGARANVLRTFTIYGSGADGRLPGFNLDGAVTTGKEEGSCGIEDTVSPEGDEGVDNQLGVLWPALEPLVGEAVKALLQNAINDGRLLMMIELTGVDDMQNDDNVGLNFFRGSLAPTIGTQGLINPDQTFYVDYDADQTSFDGVQIQDGVVEAGPVEFKVPIEIFDANFDFHVRNGRIRFEIHEDGTFTGLMGGEVVISDVLDQLLATNAKTEAELVQPIFESNADMGFEDGVCLTMSVAFGFTGATAFVVRETAKEE